MALMFFSPRDVDTWQQYVSWQISGLLTASVRAGSRQIFQTRRLDEKKEREEEKKTLPDLFFQLCLQ